MTTVADGLFQYGGMPVGMPLFLGKSSKAFFVDPVNGSDGNPGTSPKHALASLYRAHTLMTSGNNDVCFLIGNGGSTGSVRLSLANALAAQGPTETPVTTGTLNWTKSACHLIGVSAESNNPRARIATPTGTYTQATFASGNLVVVSGEGCCFANLSVYHGFSTGDVNQIAWTDNGQRNNYTNCVFLGMNDAASAADAGSRSLKIGSAGKGEHVFKRCIIGGDTTSRTAANASLELAGGTPRNSFEDCIFPSYDGAAGAALTVLGTGASCIDRWNSFTRCLFVNGVKSGASVSAVLASLTNAAPGGLLVFKDCDTVGFTKMGDVNALANSYVSNVGGAATGALDVHPS